MRIDIAWLCMCYSFLYLSYSVKHIMMLRENIKKDEYKNITCINVVDVRVVTRNAMYLNI
jgi:hypothetical protein